MTDNKAYGLYTFFLWALLVGFAGLTLFQDKKLLPLKGYRPPIIKPNLNINNWLSGDFQTNANAQLQEDVGLQSVLVRLYNQIDYSFFGKINSKKVIMGKQKTLFEVSHIESYLGKDFVGPRKITDHSGKLKYLQDRFKSEGKNLLVILAPGKGHFFKDRLPTQYDYPPNEETNYKLWSSRLRELEVNHIDFVSWFDEERGKQAFPLFSRGGIHWSKFAESLVLDSIIHKVNDMGPWQLPELGVKKYHKNIAKVQDIDIASSLNLFSVIDTDTLGYPELWFKETNAMKPRTVIIADSFYWGLHEYGSTQKLWDKGEFWYYNRDIWNAKEKIGTTAQLDDSEFIRIYQDTDLFIIMTGEANLGQLGWGYINELYRMDVGEPIRIK